MDQHRRIKVLPGKRMVQVRQNHDGKLQALGLVDAHQLHAVHRRRGLGHRSLVRFQQPPQLGHESKEPPAAAALKGLGVAAEGDQILLSFPPAVHGPEDPQQIQRIVEVPHQPVHAHIPGRQPQPAQRFQKGPAVLAAVSGHRVVEVPLRGLSPELRQPVGGKAEHRRAQHRDQRHILPGIVHHLQQRHRRGNLHGVEKISTFLKGAGDVPLR